jgi:Ca2+-binding RTX toxin-like protein
MASSDTLSIFVPDPGTTVTQTTSSGARVLTSQTGDVTNSRVFPNNGRNIHDVSIREPASGDTRTVFSGASKDTSYLGNADDNKVVFTGNAKNTTISTGGGDDTLIANDINKGTISLGSGDNSAITGELKNTTFTAGSGADSFIITDKANSVRISAGAGDDTLIFGGKVTDSTVLLGQGADVLDFSARVQNTWIDLGNDANVDQVSFFSKGDIGSGTQIFGAGDGDLLIIGGEEYTFDTSQTAFISTQGDSITFG